ncbi:beta-propeller fold lactonase family protein [Seonamhaeicola sp. MEBiC1930]|uniref:YVTN family beta-propeller repeat protein n=1 Tax=Seonamhaeicola sp. MEBiC01930 TaxID=2976768 RepID=UPI003249DCCA
MKKLKVLALLIGLLLIILLTIFIKARTTSYNIKTEGKLFIVNKLSSNVTVFDLFKGKQIAKLPIAVEPHEVTLTFNKDKVVVTDYGAPDEIGKSLTVISSLTNEIEGQIEVGESLKPHGIVAIPNSNDVAVVTDIGNDLLVIDTATGEIKKKIPTTQIFSHLLVYHPNKPLAYVSNMSSGSISIIDVNLEKVIKVIPCGKGTEGLDITPDGLEVWVTNNKDQTISVINTLTNEIVTTLKTGEEPARLKFSIDGKYCLVSNSTSGTISVFNTASRTLLKTIYIPGKKSFIERILYHTPRPVCIIMHPNGKYAFIANSNADKVEVIDMKTFEIVSSIKTERIPDGLTIVR